MDTIDNTESPKRRIEDQAQAATINWDEPGAPAVLAAPAAARGVPLRAVASMLVNSAGVSVFPTPAAQDLAPGHYMLSAPGAQLAAAEPDCAVTDRAAEAAQPASTDLQQLKAMACDNEKCEGGHVYNTEHTRKMPCPKCAAAPATASGDDLPADEWTEADRAEQEYFDRHPDRAAVSAATKPTADLSAQLEEIAQSWDGCRYDDMMIDDIGEALRRDFAKRSLLATKPAAAPAPQALLDHAHAEPLEHPDKIAATITVKLRADSGYSADQQERISAKQWGKICAILAGKDAAPAGEVSQDAAPTAADVRDADYYRLLRDFGDEGKPAVFIAGRWYGAKLGNGVGFDLDAAMEAKRAAQPNIQEAGNGQLEA